MINNAIYEKAKEIAIQFYNSHLERKVLLMLFDEDNIDVLMEYAQFMTIPDFIESIYLRLLKINKMENFTQQQVEAEAKSFLQNLTRSDFECEKQYAKFRTYKSMLKKGKLGPKSMSNVIEFIGFQQIVSYVKSEGIANAG